MNTKMIYGKKIIDRVANLTIKLRDLQMPERFKGTIIEKWGKYWKQLGIDYKEAAVNFIEDAQNKPFKTLIYGTLCSTAYLCAKRNPSEVDFIERVRTYNNDLILVHEACHNSESALHLKTIERCFNEGVLRRLSFGVVSFMWVADYSKDVSVYKAICPYLQPEYSKFYNRVIDIGFWNKWWKIENKMMDYDVNI